MVQFGTRKDGRHYPKGSVGDPSHGISSDLFVKLRQQDARRSSVARSIDRGIKAPIDFEGKHWQQQPNRYDIRGIDDPASAKKHAAMQRYVKRQVDQYIRKYKTSAKADWDKMTPRERKALIHTMEDRIKPLAQKGFMNLTKADLDRIAKAGAILEITGAS